MGRVSRSGGVAEGGGGVPRLPTALERYLALYQAGAWWESHEALEDAWRESRSGFYHGLILLASALVHAGRGNRHGVGAQAQKTLAALAPYRPSWLGFDVDAIVELVAQWPELAAAEGDWSAAIRPPVLRPDRRHLRGDEPELRAS